MNGQNYARLDELKQKRADLFAPLCGNELWRKMNVEYDTVKDVEGVQEFKAAAEDFDKLLNALYSSVNNGTPLSVPDLKIAERKLNIIEECIKRINWNAK